MRKRTLRTTQLLALVATLAVVTPATAQTTLAGEWRSDVDAFVQKVVDAGLVPGAQIAVSQGDWVLYSQGYGSADLDSGRGVGEESRFYIASTTKALTATAVSVLAQKGVLDLDAPVTRYLPSLRFAPPLDASTIRLRDLLALNHGIEECAPVVTRTAYTGDFTPELLIDLLAGCGPSEEGRTFVYGNLGYNILGMVLDATGEGGWKEVVEREVLEPLGMRETTAYVSRLGAQEIALPHDFDAEGFHRIPLGKADANLHAAGGHFTTARDLARFVAAHASGGRLEGRQVLPREAIEVTHQLHAEQDKDFGTIHRFGWGFGWDLGTWEGRTLVHRFGTFAGYRPHLSFLPDEGLGVAVLVNGLGPAFFADDLIAFYIYDRLLGVPDIEARYQTQLDELAARTDEMRGRMRESLERRRARQAPLAHPLEAYAGVYESPRFGRMEWRVVAGGLEVHMGVAQSRAEVYDAAEDKLRVELIGGGSVVDFEFAQADGPATALVSDGESFQRVAR
jgi:CubicO group peptidase (beta-lactamase class C family)